MSQLDYYTKAWLPARDIVKTAMDKRGEVDPSGSIVVFEQVSSLFPLSSSVTVVIYLARVTLKPFESCPWKDHLFSLESSDSNSYQILYVLYPESDAPNSKWRIQCVPRSPDSFENRKSLPEPWRGVRDADLSKVAEIDGCTFCHASGFTGGAETFEGVLEMARKAMAA